MRLNSSFSRSMCFFNVFALTNLRAMSLCLGRYADQAAVDQHLTSEEFSAFKADLPTILAGVRLRSGESICPGTDGSWIGTWIGFLFRAEINGAQNGMVAECWRLATIVCRFVGLVVVVRCRKPIKIMTFKQYVSYRLRYPRTCKFKAFAAELDIRSELQRS